MTDRKPLIEVDNLRVRLNTSRGPADAVRGVSFSLARGETLGLIGESGCGKSVTAMALMGLLPDSAVVSGNVRLEGQELVGLAESDYCKLRGNRVSMIFQEPMTALNPMHTVGRQVAEPLFRPRRRAGKRLHCSTASAFPMPQSGSMPTHTSFPAVSANASPSPWRSPVSRICLSRTSRQLRSTSPFRGKFST